MEDKSKRYAVRRLNEIEMMNVPAVPGGVVRGGILVYPDTL